MGRVARGRGLPARWLLVPGGPLSPLRRTGGQDVTGWPANPKLVRHLKSTLIWTGVHVDEAVMGLSVHTDEDGGGDNPLLICCQCHCQTRDCSQLTGHCTRHLRWPRRIPVLHNARRPAVTESWPPAELPPPL